VRKSYSLRCRCESVVGHHVIFALDECPIPADLRKIGFEMSFEKGSSMEYKEIEWGDVIVHCRRFGIWWRCTFTVQYPSYSSCHQRPAHARAPLSLSYPPFYLLILTSSSAPKKSNHILPNPHLPHPMKK
jgi:hypothetical protein